MKKNRSKIKVFNLDSHYYCNLIEYSMPINVDYRLVQDFDLKSFFRNLKNGSNKNVHGWGISKNKNFFKIIFLLLRNSPFITKQKTYIIFHRVFDHFLFVILSIIIGIKPICIFHGRCEVSYLKILYFIKYLISGLYFVFEKCNLINRYFIHPESKQSYFGGTGKVQKPSVIKSMNVKSSFSKNAKCLLVGNYPERWVFSREILENVLKNKKRFLYCGESNKYETICYSRKDLIKIYESSFCFISILKEPEIYYSLTLLDACDAGLPIFCLYHPLMPNDFKKYIIEFYSFKDLNYKIDKMKSDKKFWEEYSYKSKQLLKNYFSKSDFIFTWKTLIK